MPCQKVPLRLKILYLPLRIFFALLYHQFAWIYDWVAAIVSLGKWQEWVLAILPYLEGSNILELGHGPGHLQAALLKIGDSTIQKISVFGLDQSPQMGRIARRRLTHLGVSPSLVNGYAQLLPFSNGFFNQVVATFPTEYIADPSTLAEIWRVLAPGGKLVILPLAWITGQRWRERLVAWVSRITGQSPHWDEAALTPFLKAGYQVQAERVKLQSSEVLILIATRSLS
jgi:ubiquinone/menaquinone biosynthesis C-methylase UbiE